MNMTGRGSVALTLNGDPHTVPAGTTVGALLAALDLEPRGVAVAVDGDVVPRRTWAERELAGGDAVEILSIAQGG
jgi:sulfur carrier protein